MHEAERRGRKALRPEGAGWGLSAHTAVPAKLGGQLPAGLFSARQAPGEHRKSEPGVWGAPTACQAAGALPSCGEGGLLPPWERGNGLSEVALLAPA